MGRLLPIVRVALVILVLHLGLAIYYWLPEPRLANFLAPTWDLLVLGALAAGWSLWRDRTSSSARLGGLSRSRAGDRESREAGDRESRGAGDRESREAGDRESREAGDRESREAGDRESREAGDRPRPARAVSRAEMAVQVVVVGALTIFVALGFAQGFAHHEFGYDFVLPLHAPYVPELFRMLYDHEPLVKFLLYCGLLLVALLIAIAAIYLAVRTLFLLCRDRRGKLATVAAVGAVPLLAGVTVGVQPPIAGEAVSQVRFAVNLEERLEETAHALEVRADRNRPENPFVRREENPSIFNFVIESYGAAVFHDDSLAARAEEALPAHLERLREAGYAVRTGYLDAPVFGGSSWIAQQTLLCGVWVDDQARFESMFETTIPCVPHLFNDAGYRTIVAAGNTTFLEDRYERKFPWDAYYFRDDFHYEGRRYGWGYIPDQFAIHFIDREEISRRDGPFFAHYQLTTSHHPWSEVPPYVEDWERIDDGAGAFSGPGQEYANQFVTGTDYKPGYWATVDYSMRAITDYAANLDDDDALIFILGDHQPRAPVADMNEDPWWVPVHVASRDHEAVERFAPLGYIEGIWPPDLDPDDPEREPDGLDHFIRHLFEASASDDD